MDSCILPHLSSAAWLYAQFEPDRSSYLVDFDRLRHYQRIFAANLDGILAAEYTGIEEPLSELNRWKGHGEFFASLYLALEKDDTEIFRSVYLFLTDHTSQPFLDAAAHVFLWLSPNNADKIFKKWHSSKDRLLQQIALSARGLRRESCPFAIESLFNHHSPGLRAEVCRYAGRLRRFDTIPYLQRALSDADDAVREQTAIALLTCNEPQAALPGLYEAIKQHADCAASGEGAASIRSERRAQHLARLFGHAIPYPCTQEAADALIAELPPYLAILTLAHHGNPAQIPHLLAFMEHAADGYYKRRALWAMSFMLGINPESEGLLSDNPSLSADWPRMPGLEQDTGLPEPDAQKVAQWWATHQSHYKSVCSSLLSGVEMNAIDAAQKRLADGMQAQRFAASLHVCRLNRNAPWVDTRMPIAMQRRLCALIPDS